MFLEGILSIAGQPGLLKLVSKKNNSVIVESLITGKRMPAFSTSRISTLEDITVYTYDNDTPLKDVFANIFNEYKGAITGVTAKSEKNEIFAFFEKVLPDFDKEKVYPSDIKKIISWYNLLVEKGIISEEAMKAYAEEKANSEKEQQAEPEETKE
ncbi:MAG: DUF5606 domain-containing protein [Bacteroidales bacterium]|nr:DUF5606 domain-containing protein [Bacteroidales bacterium]